MLTDILGTLLAFITIILLLSVLVTALVQASQAILGLRGRNLLEGITRLIQAMKGANGGLTKKDAKKKATEILNDPSIALMYHLAKPTSGAGRIWRALRGPGVSWVNPEELAGVIADRVPNASAKLVTDGLSKNENPVGEVKSEPTEGGNGMVIKVKTMEDQLSKRFALQARGLSILWALAVAIGFQVSAPRLLVDLSNDSVRRDLIIAQSKKILDQEKQTLTVLKSETHLQDVIPELAKRVPKHAQRLEELSGVGTTKEFLLEELRLVLKDVPEREDVVKIYSTLLDEATERRGQALSDQIGMTTSALAGFDIRFWRNPHFFKDGVIIHYDALLGVILTAILLSFGAPFWYQMLRDVAALRDRLKPGATVTTEKTESYLSTSKKEER